MTVVIKGWMRVTTRNNSTYRCRSHRIRPSWAGPLQAPQRSNPQPQQAETRMLRFPFAQERFAGSTRRSSRAASVDGSLAMTMTAIRIPAAQIRPGFAQSLSLSKARGRRESGCTTHPLLARKTKRRTRGQHRYAEIIRHPSQWACGCPRSPRRTGFFATVACKSCSQTCPLHCGTGPHGMPVRFGSHHLSRFRVHRVRLTSGEQGPAPPVSGGLASLNHKFCLSERHILPDALAMNGQNRRRILGDARPSSWSGGPKPLAGG